MGVSVADSQYPTDALLAYSPLPPLEGPESIAERLVLLVHYGVDFDIWGGLRRVRYWDALTERVKAGTYAGPTLADWWSDVSALISSTPRDASEREELAVLISTSDDRAVLGALRKHAEVLVLRVRVIAEHRRSARTTRTEREGE
jgi:hypothetical protein